MDEMTESQRNFQERMESQSYSLKLTKEQKIAKQEILKRIDTTIEQSLREKGLEDNFYKLAD